MYHETQRHEYHSSPHGGGSEAGVVALLTHQLRGGLSRGVEDGGAAPRQKVSHPRHPRHHLTSSMLVLKGKVLATGLAAYSQQAHCQASPHSLHPILLTSDSLMTQETCLILVHAAAFQPQGHCAIKQMVPPSFWYSVLGTVLVCTPSQSPTS